MNERILQLAEQANVLESEHYDNELEIKKFAELIVLECEKVILAKLAVTDIDGEVERAWEMGMECGVYTIKEHFGVEE